MIKVIWGSRWDPLLARDHEGLLLARMEEAVDGDYQTYKSRNGAYAREHFFGTYPELRAMVADMTDDDIWRSTAAATTRTRSTPPTTPRWSTPASRP